MAFHQWETCSPVEYLIILRITVPIDMSITTMHSRLKATRLSAKMTWYRFCVSWIKAIFRYQLFLQKLSIIRQNDVCLRWKTGLFVFSIVALIRWTKKRIFFIIYSMKLKKGKENVFRPFFYDQDSEPLQDLLNRISFFKIYIDLLISK